MYRYMYVYMNVFMCVYISLPIYIYMYTTHTSRNTYQHIAPHCRPVSHSVAHVPSRICCWLRMAHSGRKAARESRWAGTLVHPSTMQLQSGFAFCPYMQVNLGFCLAVWAEPSPCTTLQVSLLFLSHLGLCIQHFLNTLDCVGVVKFQ